MESKFKKGQEVYSKYDFKKVIIDETEIVISKKDNQPDDINVKYMNLLDKKKSSRTIHSERYLTSLDCTKALIKAKKLIEKKDYELNIFKDKTEENIIVEQALKLHIWGLLRDSIDEFQANIIE